MEQICNINDIQKFLVDYGTWIFPLLLFFLQFLLKRFVYNKPSGFEIWKSVLEIPIDLKLIAISFLMAAAIVKTEFALTYLGLSLFFLFVIAVSIILWACSPKHASGQSIAISSVLGIVNLGMALFLLTFAINLLQQKGQ